MTGWLEEGVGRMTPAQRAACFDDWTEAEKRRLAASFGFTARAAQHEPPGDWATWLVMAGRGFGKTRAGAEWVRRLALRKRGLTIALVGATHHDVRSVMIEGPSGLLAIGAPDKRPAYEPSNRLLRWETGSVALIFSAEEPDSLRGPAFHAAWGDEIARWPGGLDVWANLQMALRRGQRPRAVLTTTPRPTPLVRRLLAEAASGRTVVTRGRTADNAANLPRAFVEAVTEMYGGTALGRQELDGELIEEVEGALWTRGMIEGCRCSPLPLAGGGVGGEGGSPPFPDMCRPRSPGPSPRGGEGRWRRVVVGVDPPASSGERADACGIVVCALGDDGRGYVLADASVRAREPNGWADAVARTYHAFAADRVVAEANNGGDMVAGVLTAVDARLPVKLVRASRGKSARAEPVAALYAAGRVSHAGVFPELEDEMCGMTAGGDYHGPGRSPDRADALVWALTELMLGPPPKALPRAWVG